MHVADGLVRRVMVRFVELLDAEPSEGVDDERYLQRRAAGWGGAWMSLRPRISRDGKRDRWSEGGGR